MMVSRRRFLRQTIGFSAAAAVATQLSGCARTLVPPTTSAGKPFPPAEWDPASRHLLAIGDYGVPISNLKRQQAVAGAMSRYVRHGQLRADGLILLGDNFYGGLSGKGVASPRWGANIENMYPPQSFPGPLYAMLGNHDYHDEPKGRSAAAQLAYRATFPASRWTMPHNWYQLALPDNDGNPLADVLVLDTNYHYTGLSAIAGAARRRALQLAWLTAELQRPRSAPWRFVFAHHPLYSDGAHGDNRRLIADLDPLLRRHGVDLYLAGHDHDMQHIAFDGHPTSFVVNGAGGVSARAVKRTRRAPFAEGVYGFTHLSLNREAFTIRHVDVGGTVLHAFSKSAGG